MWNLWIAILVPAVVLLSGCASYVRMLTQQINGREAKAFVSHSTSVEQLSRLSPSVIKNKKTVWPRIICTICMVLWAI